MFAVAMAMQIINRMVENQILEKGSDFWCYAIHVLEDAVKREIFLNMDDDDSRLKWLQYLQDEGQLSICFFSCLSLGICLKFYSHFQTCYLFILFG